MHFFQQLIFPMLITKHTNRWRDDNETRAPLPTGHRKSIEGGESIRARTVPAGFQLLPVTGNNHFSLITFEHNAQPQSDCELGVLGVAGPRQIAKAFLADASGPRTAHDVRRDTRQGTCGLCT
jgi:hypothetical protein